MLHGMNGRRLFLLSLTVYALFVLVQRFNDFNDFESPADQSSGGGNRDSIAALARAVSKQVEMGNRGSGLFPSVAGTRRGGSSENLGAWYAGSPLVPSPLPMFKVEMPTLERYAKG